MKTIIKNSMLPALLIIVGLTCWTESVLAQNRYFDGKTTGATTSVTISSGPSATGLGFGAAVTVRGRLDLGLSLTSLSPKSSYSGISAKGYTAGITYAFRRPEAEEPWGAEAWAQFDWLDYGGRYPGYGGRGQSVGFNFYQRRPAAKNVRWIPVVGIGYVWARNWAEASSMPRIENRDESLLLGLELGIHFDDQVFISPQMVYVDNDYSFALVAGLNFS